MQMISKAKILNTKYYKLYMHSKLLNWQSNVASYNQSLCHEGLWVIVNPITLMLV